MIKLNLEASKFTLEQRIKELMFFLRNVPNSEFSARRQIELDAAREQLKRLEDE